MTLAHAFAQQNGLVAREEDTHAILRDDLTGWYIMAQSWPEMDGMVRKMCHEQMDGTPYPFEDHRKNYLPAYMVARRDHSLHRRL